MITRKERKRRRRAHRIALHRADTVKRLTPEEPGDVIIVDDAGCQSRMRRAKVRFGISDWSSPGMFDGAPSGTLTAQQASTFMQHAVSGSSLMSMSRVVPIEEEQEPALTECDDPPPFAILVSGGKLTDGAAEKLRDYIDKQKKGGSFHSILTLDATPGARVEVQPIAGGRPRRAAWETFRTRKTRGAVERLRRRAA